MVRDFRGVMGGCRSDRSGIRLDRPQLPQHLQVVVELTERKTIELHTKLGNSPRARAPI